MHPAPETRLETLVPHILTAFPRLHGTRFTLETEGWDSLAVDAGGAMIFKFPRHKAAEERLIREARLLAAVAPAVTMPLPVTTLHQGERLFSSHVKIPGGHLTAENYDILPETARKRLASDMATFFAQLHALPPPAEAATIGAWNDAATIAREVAAVLPASLRDFAARTLDAYAALPPDPQGEVFGYFDGHGWNMAFDHAAHRLNGVYDFGDSGIGPLHREFVPPGFIARDLTLRIADRYEAITGRTLDRARIDTLTAVLRLDEMAGVANDPALLPRITAMAERWAAGL